MLAKSPIIPFTYVMIEFDGEFPDEPLDEAVAKLSKLTGQPEEEIHATIERLKAEEVAKLDADTEREERMRVLGAAALRDEEHVHHTMWLYLSTTEVHETVHSGRLTPQMAASFASIVVSDTVTKRHFGASQVVGEAVARLVELPS